MFKRRQEPSLISRILGFLWPAMGWRRTTAYLLHRLGRMPGSAYSIAGGFACGAAVSFTPFVGLHFVFGAILAWLLRTNIVASAIGTAIGNPWTFPFIWAWLYQTGTLITEDAVSRALRTEDFGELFGHMLQAMISFDMEYILETAVPVFWPMLLSSVPTGIIVWWSFYLPLKYVIQRYQDRRQKKRQQQIAGPQEETP